MEPVSDLASRGATAGRFPTAFWPRCWQRPAQPRFWPGAGVRDHATGGSHAAGVSGDWGGPGGFPSFWFARCRAFSCAAQARRLDGKIQNRHGLSHAGNGPVAGLRLHPKSVGHAIAGVFPRDAGAGRRGSGGSSVQRGTTPKTPGSGALHFAGRGGFRLPAAASQEAALWIGKYGARKAVEQARKRAIPCWWISPPKTCLNCIVNKASSLEIRQTRAKLLELAPSPLRPISPMKTSVIAHELAR